jgi:hypothetical protein
VGASARSVGALESNGVAQAWMGPIASSFASSSSFGASDCEIFKR